MKIEYELTTAELREIVDLICKKLSDKNRVKILK